MGHTKGKMVKVHVGMMYSGSSEHWILGASSGLDREVPCIE